MKTSQHIILMHGNFVTNRAWDAWKAHYESKGYIVHTPANPGHDGNPADLRRTEHPELAGMGFVDVVENVVELIDTLPEKPLVVGHSMAGLAVMKLAEMGKISAGVTLAGAPPKNVFPVPWQTLKTVFSSIGIFSTKKTWMGSPEWFSYAFFNTLPEAERTAAFEQHAVPESFKVTRQLLLHPMAKVDFKASHAPLLFVGGTSDNIFPASFTRRIAGKYKAPDGVVDVKIFEGRSHFICGEPGWEEVADYVLDWLETSQTDLDSEQAQPVERPRKLA